jgi:glycosyltransferase involved in cell wall biosynthesis
MLVVYLRLSGLKTGMKLVNESVISALNANKVNFRLVQINGYLSLLKMFYEILFKLNKNDRVYCNSSGSLFGLLLSNTYLFLANICKVEVIMHSHNGNFTDYRFLRNLLFKQVKKGQSKLIVLSEKQNRLIFREYGAETIVINNCIRDEFFRSLPPQNRKFKIGKVRVICVSNFVRGKGHLELLELFEDSFVNIELVLVGGIVDRKYFESLRLENFNNVTIYTNVDDVHRLIDLYDSCDYFWFPSNYMYESAPLVICEAMSRGLKIVTRNIGATSELVDGGDYLMYDSLAEAKEIVRSLEGSCDSRSSINQSIALEKFSSRRFHAMLIDLLV